MVTPATTVRMPWLGALFFVSGAVGLAYEVAWSRALLLLLGSTAGASAVVLGVFVGALGLGARWGGPRAERHERPLSFYGVLEIGAALWALLSLVLLPVLATPYVAIASGMPASATWILRLVVATLVVAPSAFLLGATLPAMVRQAVVGENQTGHRTAWLYGLNTVGAVVGTLATGYFGVAALGVTGVMAVAAAIGGATGVVAIVLARRVSDRAPVAVDATQDAQVSIFGLAFLCGLLGLGVEIAGFRILVFFVEGFTVTFASMLGVFVAGLGLGSLVLGGLFARTTRPARALGVILVLVSGVLLVALFVVIPGFEETMRTIKASAYGDASSSDGVAAGLRWSSLAGSAVLLFLPAFLLGPTFPLCVRHAERQGATPGRAVGRTYLGNSLGSVVAPLLVTFFVIPTVGVLGAWLSLAVLALLGGLNLLLLPLWRRVGSFVPIVSWGAVAALALLAPLAGIRAATPEALIEASVVLHGRPDRTLVDYQTDALTTASVIETDDGERILYTDDFPAAATGRYYRYMRMLGHLPGLLAKDPEHAMVIAFGTGTTAGAVAKFPDVKRLEVVEVSDAVIRLAGHFKAANRGVLEDPRVKVVRDDGRNTLLLHEPDLDLITLEPLMPYSPAGLPFYTREFYELAKARLREGGVLCQWVPVHAMPADLYAAFVRTFFEVFPDGTLWFFEQSSALIGRKGTAQPDDATMARRIESIRDDLAAAGFEDPRAFVSGFVATGRDVLQASAPPGDRFAGRPVRDADPYPEFAPTPRAGLNTTYLQDTLRWLASLVDPEHQPEDRTFWTEDLDHETRAGTKSALEARTLEAHADYLTVFAQARSLPKKVRGAALRDALALRDEAALRFEDGPAGDRVIRRRRLANLRLAANVRTRALLQHALGAERDAEAHDIVRQAHDLIRKVLPPIEADPEPIATHLAATATLCAVTQVWMGRCAAALETLRRARVALARDGDQDALSAEIAAVETWAKDGTFAAVPRHLAWVFRTGRRGMPPPCRRETLGLVETAWRGWIGAALSGRGFALAADRLESAATRQGAEAIVLAELGDGPPADSSGYVVYLALVQRLSGRSFGGDDDPLRAMLRSEDAKDRIRALDEVGRRKALAAYGARALLLADDTDSTVRRLFIRAAAKVADRAFVCRIVNLLMDPDVDVRKDAVGALFGRADDLLQRYDPLASATVRQRVVDQVAARLGCR